MRLKREASLLPNADHLPRLSPHRIFLFFVLFRYASCHIAIETNIHILHNPTYPPRKPSSLTSRHFPALSRNTPALARRFLEIARPPALPHLYCRSFHLQEGGLDSLNYPSMSEPRVPQARLAASYRINLMLYLSSLPEKSHIDSHPQAKPRNPCAKGPHYTHGASSHNLPNAQVQCV